MKIGTNKKRIGLFDGNSTNCNLFSSSNGPFLKPLLCLDVFFLCL